MGNAEKRAARNGTKLSLISAVWLHGRVSCVGCLSEVKNEWGVALRLMPRDLSFPLAVEEGKVEICGMNARIHNVDFNADGLVDDGLGINLHLPGEGCAQL